MPSFESVTPRTTSNWTIAKHEESAASPEQVLLDAIIRLHDFREQWVAAQIYLSKLQRHHRKDHYLRLATDMFESHVKGSEGRLFTLSSGDLFFLGKGMGLTALRQAVDRLRLLFAEDPLARYATNGKQDGFASTFDLERDYEALREHALGLHKAMEKRRRARQQTKDEPAPKARPFMPGDLSKLIAIIERADLTAILRRQTACALDAGGLPQPLFQEHFVSMDDLQQICTPDIDLRSDRWLFHYLTRTLDLRVMAAMSHNGIRADLPFSLNLNIATLLAPEFRRFDALVPPDLRGRMVVEIHKLDVFSDIGAYIFARDFLHDKGYKLCLDGLTHHTLPFFDENRLGLDYFKIYWAPEGLNAAHTSTYPQIRELVTRYSPRRIVLCRAEDEEALKIGRELGITQYQGRYIDHLLALSKGQRALPKA